MSITKWRGIWYVYNHVTREFLREVRGDETRWTPGIKLAWAYKNPSQAQKRASRLNAALHHPGCACWPCNSARPEGGLSAVDTGCPGAKPAAERSDRRWAVQPVSVVTGEAARCLEQINRRDSAAAGTSSVTAGPCHLPQRGRHT